MVWILTVTGAAVAALVYSQGRLYVLGTFTLHFENQTVFVNAYNVSNSFECVFSARHATRAAQALRLMGPRRRVLTPH